MFTIFHGFHLVEAYHEWKKEHRKNRNPLGTRVIKIGVATIVALFFWLAPSALYGLPGINVIESRCLAIFAFAALMWLLEPVPAWTSCSSPIGVPLPQIPSWMHWGRHFSP